MRILVFFVAFIVIGLILIGVGAAFSARAESKRALKKRANELDLLVARVERIAIKYNNIDHACAGAVLAEIDTYRQKEITK